VRRSPRVEPGRAHRQPSPDRASRAPMSTTDVYVGFVVADVNGGHGQPEQDGASSVPLSMGSYDGSAGADPGREHGRPSRARALSVPMPTSRRGGCEATDVDGARLDEGCRRDDAEQKGYEEEARSL